MLTRILHYEICKCAPNRARTGDFMDLESSHLPTDVWEQVPVFPGCQGITQKEKMADQSAKYFYSNL